MKRRIKIVLSVLGILVLTGMVLAIWLLMPEEMIKPDMVRQEQSSFIYYYEPQDRANAEKLMRVLDQDHAHITQTLDWHPSAKTTVVMYSEQSEFQRAARGRISDYLGADWFIVDNRADAVLIMSPGIRNRTNGPDEIVQAAAHEYVHMVEDNINKDLPIYWHEGIAMYLAGQKVQGRINMNRLPDANKVFKTGLQHVDQSRIRQQRWLPAFLHARRVCRTGVWERQAGCDCARSEPPGASVWEKL